MNNVKTTKEWEVLFDKLQQLQNQIEHIDILTVTSFMSTIEELEKHLESSISKSFLLWEK